MEQPSGSADCLPFHPRLDWFFAEVCYAAWFEDWIFKSAKAFKCDFWMMLHGASCPKRTSVWSAYGDIIAKLAPSAQSN